MPSTYTASLALEKQATGEASGTWGTALNTVLDNIDTAIAGYLSKSVAGAADVTLTAAEALNATIKLTGALTGNINLIVPTVEQKWAIDNATTGAYTVTVKTTAGTGVLVAQGEKMNVYGDGTDVLVGMPTAYSGAVFTIFDPTDSTKKARFRVANLQGTVTSTYDLPANSGTIVTAAGTTTLTNKTINAPAIANPTYSGTATGSVAGGTYDAALLNNPRFAGTATGTINQLTYGNPTFFGTATGTVKWQGPQSGYYGTIADVAPDGTVTPGFGTAQSFILTMTTTGTTTRLVANPTSPGAGQSGLIEFKQPAGGHAHVTWGAGYKFASGTAIALSSGTSQRDVVPYAVLNDGTSVLVSSILKHNA